ncbi:MAG: flagellar biosynthetic protein FliO [Bdellovibrionales bacterium]|nr:flagellar biosynthetic protein FliO [Bdellovibrionales bacterium]
MKLLVLLISLFCWTVQAKEASKLVDVDKDSSLSEYFSKLNTKVSDDPEQELIQASEDLKSISEEEIPLEMHKQKAAKVESMSPLQKMVFVLGALVLVAGVLFFNIHRFSKRRGEGFAAKNINIISKKPLGPKKELVLIQIAGETILLGVTDQNINCIKTLSLLEDELPQFVEPKFAKKFQEKIEQTNMDEGAEEVDGFTVSKLDDVRSAVSERFSI